MPALSCQSQRHLYREAPFKLSICIPTWNRASSLEKQLANIASSLSQDIEVVVIDNGSDDSTWAVIEDEASINRMCIKGLKNPVNLGICLNLLRTFEQSSGAFTWIVGDDDLQINMAKSIEAICDTDRIDAACMILLDRSDSSWAGVGMGRSLHLSFEQFLDSRYDFLGECLHQISRVVIRTDHALSKLRLAYSRGIGNLHAHSYVYAPIIQETGLDILYIDRFFQDVPPALVVKQPRWDLLNGHIGAWLTSIDIFSAKQSEAQDRERRLRRMNIIMIMARRIEGGQGLTMSDWQFAKNQLGYKTYYHLRLKSLFCKLKGMKQLQRTSEGSETGASGY